MEILACWIPTDKKVPPFESMYFPAHLHTRPSPELQSQAQWRLQPSRLVTDNREIRLRFQRFAGWVTTTLLSSSRGGELGKASRTSWESMNGARMDLGIISFPSKSPYLQVFVPKICCKTGKPYMRGKDQELHSLLHHVFWSRIGTGFLIFKLWFQRIDTSVKTTNVKKPWLVVLNWDWESIESVLGCYPKKLYYACNKLW